MNQVWWNASIFSNKPNCAFCSRSMKNLGINICKESNFSTYLYLAVVKLVFCIPHTYMLDNFIVLSL